MSKNIAKFRFNGTTIPIEITWKLAYSVLPEKFEIKLLELFVNEEHTGQTIGKILLDDNLALHLCWFFLEPKVSYEFEKFLDLLDDEPNAIEEFREVFWAAAVNFSSPQKKGVLREMWDQMRKELKKLTIESVTSSTPPSDSSQEESTSTP